MNYFEVQALRKSARATIDIPGSKSYTNRALIMASLTKGAVTLHNPLYSDDTLAMIDCLKTLGLEIEILPNQLIVHNDISVIKHQSYELFAKDSGTTIRFLLALLCLTPGTKVIKGNTRLNERPIEDLVNGLLQLGATIDYLEKKGQPPLKIYPCSLTFKKEVTIDATISSQFITALLLIAPLLNGLTIHLIGEAVSKPYIDMTIDMMKGWGVDVLQLENGGYDVASGQHYQKDQYVIEGDFSSAGYFFAIAALNQSTITLKNLNPNSAQADRRFLDILKQMGHKVKIKGCEITISGKQIIPQTLNMQDCPDQVQTMAVLAAFANGVTKISGVRSLRLKETERVQALKNELLKMGIQTEDTLDTLTIYGGNPHAATIETYGDHRMAMAFAVAATKLPGMKILNPEVVNKTFPTFWDILRSL